MKGRPSKLTHELRERIVALVASGVPLDTAGRSCGLGKDVPSEWLRRGEGRDDRPGREPFVGFTAAVRQAEGQAEAEAVAQLLRGDWKGAAWFLERRFPERWSMSPGKGGRPVGSGSAPDRRPGEPPRLTVVRRTDADPAE